MLETKVHSELLSFLRNTKSENWIHHLTMARLIARGLRLERSAIIQTGVNRNKYYLSYLTPALLTQKSVILVTSSAIQKQLIEKEIPELQLALNTTKLVINNYQENIINKSSTLILISPSKLLEMIFNNDHKLLKNIPIMIEEAEKLEQEIRQFLSITIESYHWLELQQELPQYKTLIRDILIKLTVKFFAHPENPEDIFALEKEEYQIILDFLNFLLKNNHLITNFETFYQKLIEKNNIIYVKLNRKKGVFSLTILPLNLDKNLINKIWLNLNIFLISSYLENTKEAFNYCQSLGLDNSKLTCLKFNTDPQNNLVKLYLPKNIPLPNTPQFQEVSIKEIMALIGIIKNQNQLNIILTNDVPLKGQFASKLAAHFGSRVTLENQNLSSLKNKNILICGWDFWKENQYKLPTPKLIIIATLPIPSLENPLICARVNYEKNQGNDWFRNYLLPIAIREMQNSLISIRDCQGVLALLDSRVNFRSYGTIILKALEPFAIINYLDLTWFL